MNVKSIKKIYIRYVSLNIIGMIGLSCNILADTFFIAQGVGAVGLAALNIAIPMYSFIHGVGLMIGMGSAIRFTLTKAKTIFTQSIYYAFVLSILFLLMGLLFSRELATVLGSDGVILTNTSTYLKVILCFAPLFILNNVLICFVRNDNNPQLSMLAMLAGSFSNIILDYIFIFPLGLGMFGAAVATGLSPCISILVLSTHFLKKKNTFKLQKCMPQLKSIIDISTLGISALITELSSGIVIIVFNMIILSIAGNIGVAAYGIIANITLVILAIFTGISQGMQPLISGYFKENNRHFLRKLLKYGAITTLTISLLVYLISIFYAETIVSYFNSEKNIELAKIAVNGLRIYFTAFSFVGINILICAFFSSIDKPKNAFIISMLRGFIIIIPVAFILSSQFGLNGVWMTLTVTELIVLGISFIFIYYNRDFITHDKKIS